ERGAEVTLVAGHVSVPIPAYLNVIHVESTEDMYEAVMARKEEMDVIIKAAAPADYRPAKPFDNKVKSDTLTLELVKTPDIAQAVGQDKGETKLVVFAAETQALVANAKSKLVKKNADMVVANDVTQEGAGFGVDTNIVTIVTRDGEEPLPKMSKEELADELLDRILRLW
ncbi:MAG: phosphopantothenoylcysteine decarboxylase, partial [Clostridia bacterium]|nr:phosphopantothenoylcysteine decarboxylase [Clostridia bacterium]